MKTLSVVVSLLVTACGAGESVDVDDVTASAELKRKPPTTPTYPDLMTPGVVACYTDGAPNATCAPGVACNFNNYSSSHNGYCQSGVVQSYGLELCDGNEDCATGNRCCLTMGRNSWDNIIATMACQADACSTDVGNYEMCHPTANAWGTCTDTTKRCIDARTAGQYSVPRNLYVCK